MERGQNLLQPDESAFAGPADSSFYGSVTCTLLAHSARASFRCNTSRSPTLRANADEYFRDPTYSLFNKAGSLILGTKTYQPKASIGANFAGSR
jgi:hypothetical protein